MRRFPEQLAGGAVEREQMGVVGDEEDLVAQDRDAAIGAELRIADEPGARRARVLPERIRR